jgi:hypothetical protein
MENKKEHPLILVFYLDSEMMNMREIIQPFAEMVNQMIIEKEANAMAFFLPTKGEERIECLNPAIMSEPDTIRINQMIEDIKTNFSIGTEMNLPDEDILVDNNCKCENNINGKCECNG